MSATDTLPARRHAFVVDDDRAIRSLIARVLIETHFTAHEFERIEDVEAALTRVRPAVVVLDLSLGGSDAIEVMHRLSEARFKGQVLLASVHDRSTLAQVQGIGVRLGLAMQPVVRKPFSVAALRERFSAIAEAATFTSTGADLAAGLENNWLELWYQPQVDLKTMAISGAEALIRMRHPERGIVAPAKFLPPAGDALYRPLTDFVVRRALADWTTLAAAGLAVRLAVNVPASDLQRPGFVEEVRRHLPGGTGFPGLTVEITEDEAITDSLHALEAAIRLKLYNIQVCVDDFGKGHSTLARLDELPFAELKLDRAYVDGCSRDADKRAICKGVVELAHRHGVRAVAEGVETEEDLGIVSDLGYDVVQGYLFGKPMELGDFVSLAPARILVR